MFLKRISQLKQSEVNELVSIQKEELSKSFINNFGDSFLQFFFNKVIENPDNFLIIIKEKNKVIGFAIVCKNSRNFINDIIRKDYSRIALYYLKAWIKKPSILIKVISTVLINKKPKKIPVELLYLAISKKYQKRGLGKKLIQEANKILKKEGIRKYLVGTRNDNKNSNSFYRHLGFKYLFSGVNFGATFNYYYLDPKNKI